MPLARRGCSSAARMRLRRVCMLPVLATLAFPAAAQVRELDIEVAMGGQVDRNARLAPGERDMDAGTRWGIDVNMVSGDAPNIVQLPRADRPVLPGDAEGAVPVERLHLEASGLRYGSASDLDDDRQAASYGRTWRGAVSSADLQLSAVDRDARTSESGFGSGEAVRDDDQRRREYSGQLGGEWRLDENIASTLGLAALRTEFHDGTVRRLADYDYVAATVGLRVDIDEYSQATFALTRDRFESTLGRGNRTEDTWGLRLDYALALSESTRIRVGAGVRNTRTEAMFRTDDRRLVASERRTGLLGEFALEHSWSAGELAVSVARTRQPSGVGTQFERDEATFDGRMPLDDVRTLTLSATVDRNRADGGAGIPDERLWSVRAGLAWQPDEAWECNLQVGYRAQRIDGSDSTGVVPNTQANGAVVQFGVRYQLDPVLL